MMSSSSSSNSDHGGEAVDYDYQEEYVRNSRGMNLFTCRWVPRKAIKALVFLCHGYAVECAMTMRGTGERLARAGYAVHGLDYEGHGRSDGLQGYVPDFQALVGDCDAFFTSVARSHAGGRFLLGESMGGAVALLLHRARPDFYSGAVLVAPMCKIADDMQPHPVVVSVLKAMTGIIPTWRIVPTSDVIDAAYRSHEKRDEIRGNPYCYKGRPRLRTAYELLNASMDLEKNVLQKVSLPFLIVHGGADKVTDPAVSELLYRSAASEDKTLKLYPGMWHALTSGESPDNIGAVFRDIIGWLDQRSDATEEEPSSEMEQKARHDDQHHCRK